MKTSRRFFLAGLMQTTAAAGFGQGMASRNSRALPRNAPSGLPFNARFTDVASRAGLCGNVYGRVDQKKYIIESLGCGCAFFDYDNDGWLDVFLLSGTRLADPPGGVGNRLFKNNRDGTFTDVTEQAGLLKIGWACGVCVGDYNNDGYEDLFLTYWGQNILYRNNGNGTFTDVTRAAGLSESGSRWGTGCTFLDYDRDGHLDLFVADYLGFGLEQAPVPGETANCRWKGTPVFCGPRGYPHGQHRLYRNNGNGGFKDVSVESGIAAANSSYGLTAVAADFDDDGWPDIYVACDSTPSLLFLNNHDGTFREEAGLRGVAYSEDGQEQAGMGVAVGDYDLDGHLDIFKTNFQGDTSDLYHNMGNTNFEDATRQAGLAVENRFVCWGAGMVDLDNNGLPDIFVVAGHIFPEIEKRFPDLPAKNPRMLFRNLGKGRFEELAGEAGPAIAQPHVSRGCAFGDFDNDGDIDILIVNLNEPPSLLRNDVAKASHWLKVRLIGTVSNRSAIGARVLVRVEGKTQTQEVMSQSSFLSCSDFRLHFGLGPATKAELDIRWPNGLWQKLPSVPANQLVTVKEGAGIVASVGWK